MYVNYSNILYANTCNTLIYGYLLHIDTIKKILAAKHREIERDSEHERNYAEFLKAAQNQRIIGMRIMTLYSIPF